MLDEQRDTLSPDDRRAVTVAFGQALAKNGAQVTNTNCTETYTFYHVKLGNTIQVYVVSPKGNRDAKVSKIDDLPNIYEQMAHSLATGTTMQSADNSDRTNVTTEQMAPKRIAADGLKYVRLGYGAVTGSVTTPGTAFGFGYRYELDEIAIDIAAFNMVYAASNIYGNTGQSKGGINGELIGIGAIRYQNPIANTSLYYGGRVGYGISSVVDTSNDSEYTGSGIQLTAVVGYETLRASTIRLFVELDVTGPLYKSDGTMFDSNFNTTSIGSKWAPVASLTIGAGLGHSNTVNVVNR